MPESCETCVFRMGAVMPMCGCERSEFFAGPVDRDGWCRRYEHDRIARAPDTNTRTKPA